MLTLPSEHSGWAGLGCRVRRDMLVVWRRWVSRCWSLKNLPWPSYGRRKARQGNAIPPCRQLHPRLEETVPPVESVRIGSDKNRLESVQIGSNPPVSAWKSAGRPQEAANNRQLPVIAATFQSGGCTPFLPLALPFMPMLISPPHHWSLTWRQSLEGTPLTRAAI